MDLAQVYSRIQAILPSRMQPILRPLAYRYIEWRFRWFVRNKIGPGLGVQFDPGPVPPRELIATTSLLTQEEIEEKADPNVYFGSGYLTILRFLQELDRHSCNLRELNQVLEFGCGTGRLLHHLRRISDLRIVGTDVNPDCIEWCRQHLTGIEFHVNDLIPPLSFAEDGTFDFVYAQSVFTHITLDLQRRWLIELRRTLRPGGYFICNMYGSRHIELMLNRQDKEELSRRGRLVLDSKHPRASYSTQVGGSWDVFQSREEVRRVFGSVFEVLDYGFGPHQDLLVMRRP